MAYAEANAKWFRLANHCFVDEDYARSSTPPSFIPSSFKSDSEKTSNDLPTDTKWWLYQQHEVDSGSFLDPQQAYVENNNVGILEAVISDTLQKKPMLPETWTFLINLADFSDQPGKLFSELESQWIGIDKSEPWWHTSDLASFVSHKSLEHFDNCDLPLPQRNKTGRLVCKKGLQCALDRPFSTTRSDETKNSETANSELSNDQLLEALHHSQNRAREAEKAAQRSCNEKEHVITLFLKQASQIFAYKQWLYILQLETLCLQHRHTKYQPIYTRFPDFVPKRVHHKRYKTHKSVGKFVWGFALVGAWVLLGWTVGGYFHFSDLQLNLSGCLFVNN